MFEETPSQDSESGGTDLPPSKRAKGKWIALILVGLLIVGAGIAFVFVRSGSKETSDSLHRTRAPQTIGGEVRLYIKGRDTVMVAADEKALDELITAISSPPDALQDLIQSGKVFTVPNDTRARIVAIGFGKTKVRIIEGDKILTEGWVPEWWVW
jgi:hypothetical protein